MTPSLHRAPAKRRIDDITCSRALFAAWVFAYHLNLQASFTPSLGFLGRLIERGALGVDGFFILSGMVLAYAHPDLGLTFGEAHRFWAKRLVRIYPVHLAMLAALLMMLGTGYLLHQHPRDPGRFGAGELRREGAGQASTTLPAPAAGTIVATSVDAGQVLAQGAPLMTIAPRDALAVLLGAEPESVAAVHPGMAVSLQDALDPMLPLHGTVASVGAALDPRTRLVNVLVRIAAASGTSDPPLVGRFVTGRIDAKAERVVAVLRSAVLRDSQGSYVFIVRKGAAQRVAVTPGLENEAKVAIGTALAAGAPVVVQGNYELQSGMAVREVTP